MPKLILVRSRIGQRKEENDKMQNKGYMRIRFFYKLLAFYMWTKTKICVVSRGRLLKKSMASYVSQPVFHGWRGRPRSLFGWNIGKSKDAERPQPKYYDIDPPFPLSLVSKTFLSGRELKCCYRARIDGFSATDFHKCCDFKGPCVIIGYTNKPFKFGAFNPEGYRSTDDYYDTFDAFLFYWPEGGKPDPIILPKVGGSGAALFDYACGGPQFGADGLLIGPPLAPVMGGFAGPFTNSGVGDLRQAKSRLGLSYAKRPDGKGSIFGDESRATLEEVQVFCSPEIARANLWNLSAESQQNCHN